MEGSRQPTAILEGTTAAGTKATEINALGICFVVTAGVLTMSLPNHRSSHQILGEMDKQIVHPRRGNS